MEQFLQIFLSTLVSTVLTFGLFAWVLKTVIQSKIENSVRHLYDKELEDYRYLRIRRQKAEQIANLFAMWFKYRGREENNLSKEEHIEHLHHLNKMSLEVSLWMDDVEILNDVMRRLCNAADAKTVRGIVGDVRKLILEKKDSFDPETIVLWPLDTEIDRIYGPKT